MASYDGAELKDSTAPTNKKIISRKRKIIWFYPPHNQNILQNIATIFLKLVDKQFDYAMYLIVTP